MKEVICFSAVLEAMKVGKKAKRPSWTGYIAIYDPIESDVMNQPYIYANCKDGEIVPAVITQLDILADDWIIID